MADIAEKEHKGRVKLNFETFTNCLRFQIYPDEDFEEKAKGLADYCVNNKIENVIAFLLGEAYFKGHSSKEDLRPWVENLKKAKRFFNEKGISFSLNPWLEIGHVDRGRKLRSEQNFTRMRDWNGKDAEISVCPYCENWRKYFACVQKYYVEELRPEVLWIEDDFRLHNHEPLEYGGCFCPIHLKKFNERLSANYTLKDFVEKVFQKGDPSAERRAWLDENRATMNDLALFIGENVKKANGETRVGLMSSSACAHTFEARDWHGVQTALAQGKEIINRIHLPAYNENVPAYYYRYFNMTSTVVRSCLPDSAKIYPEIESADYNNFVKDAKFLTFQIESTIPLLPSGMTYNILDMVGNGDFDRAHYGEAIAAVTPYMKAVKSLNLKFSTMAGVMIPFDENAAYHRKIRNDRRDLYPFEIEFAGYVCGLGVNYRISREKYPRGQFVCLIGNSADDFDDEQLSALFETNFVFLDGAAVERLTERNFAKRLGIVGATRIVSNQGKTAFEQAENDLIIDGKKHLRAPCEGGSGVYSTGDYLKIDYENGSVKAYSSVYNADAGFVGYGSVKSVGKMKFAVVPYYLQTMLFEQYNELRKEIIYRIIQEFAKEKLVFTGVSGIYPYLFTKDEKTVLMIVNSLFVRFEKVKFTLANLAVKQIFQIQKEGFVEEVRFERKGNEYTLETPLEYMSTVTLILN